MLKKINKLLISLFHKPHKMPVTEHKEPWSPPEKYFYKITLDDSKFIYDQATKMFDNTIDVSKTIVDRSNILLSVIIGIIIGLVGYTIDKVGKNEYDNLFFTAILATMYYFYIGVNSFVKNIKPFEYCLPGTSPEMYFLDFFFNYPSEKDQRQIMFYLTEIKSLQNKIDLNHQLNDKRWDIYSNSLMQLLCSPIIIAMLFTIIEIISILIKNPS